MSFHLFVRKKSKYKFLKNFLDDFTFSFLYKKHKALNNDLHFWSFLSNNIFLRQQQNIINDKYSGFLYTHLEDRAEKLNYESEDILEHYETNILNLRDLLQNYFKYSFFSNDFLFLYKAKKIFLKKSLKMDLFFDFNFSRKVYISQTFTKKQFLFKRKLFFLFKNCLHSLKLKFFLFKFCSLEKEYAPDLLKNPYIFSKFLLKISENSLCLKNKDKDFLNLFLIKSLKKYNTLSFLCKNKSFVTNKINIQFLVYKHNFIKDKKKGFFDLKYFYYLQQKLCTNFEVTQAIDESRALKKFSRNVKRQSRKKLRYFKSYFLFKNHKKFLQQKSTKFLRIFNRKSGDIQNSPFKEKLDLLRKLRFFLGGISKFTLKKLYVESKKKHNLSVQRNFIINLESRIDVILFRLSIFRTMSEVQQFILHGKVFVNNKKVTTCSLRLKENDVFSFKEFVKNEILFSHLKESNFQMAPIFQIPEYIEFDFLTMSGIFLPSLINENKVYYPIYSQGTNIYDVCSANQICELFR